MSDHDRNDTIAVLNKRYAEARQAREGHVRTIILFRAKLHEFAHTLAAVQGFIPSGKSIPRIPADYPAGGQIAAALDELRASCDEVALTEQLLKDAGVRDPEGSSSSFTLPMNGFVRVQRS